jgi:hypothetical protein
LKDNNMKAWQFYSLLLLAVFCMGISMATVLVARSNVQLQARLQAHQTKLNNGVLGPRGQQIAANILQSMANASATDASIRQLLAKHGYNVTGQAAAESPPAAGNEAAIGSATGPVWGNEPVAEEPHTP